MFNHKISQLALAVLGGMLSVCVYADVPVAIEPSVVETQAAQARQRELFASYAQPIISVDEVINPSSSMEGDYPIHTYGTYGGEFNWMDNQHLIFGGLDQATGRGVIQSWEVNTGDITRYSWGRFDCYADGMVRKTVRDINTLPFDLDDQLRGLIGQEKIFVFDKKIRVYDTKLECGDPPSPFLIQHVKEQLDTIVTALRPEHGFLVRAKRTLRDDGSTQGVLENGNVIFYRPGKEPLTLPVPFYGNLKATYFPFLGSYMLESKGGIYALSPEGKVQTISYPKSFPLPSRRGFVLVYGTTMPNKNNGIYLFRGEQRKRLSSENVRSGMISPNGCRLAYTTTRLDLWGNITKPTLKVMDLCEGAK